MEGTASWRRGFGGCRR